MTFRPYPGLTIACALLFAILCGLGTWQLERLQWKLALIATVNGHMAAAPISLDQIAAMKPDDAQYRRVTLKGQFDHNKEAYVFTTDAGAAVYHVLTPFKTDDGKLLMVDRGEVQKEKLDPATRAGGNVAADHRQLDEPSANAASRHVEKEAHQAFLSGLPAEKEHVLVRTAERIRRSGPQFGGENGIALGHFHERAALHDANNRRSDSLRAKTVKRAGLEAEHFALEMEGPDLAPAILQELECSHGATLQLVEVLRRVLFAVNLGVALEARESAHLKEYFVDGIRRRFGVGA